jgi:hypothetical protein
VNPDKERRVGMKQSKAFQRLAKFPFNSIDEISASSALFHITIQTLFYAVLNAGIVVAGMTTTSGAVLIGFLIVMALGEHVFSNINLLNFKRYASNRNGNALGYVIFGVIPLLVVSYIDVKARSAGISTNPERLATLYRVLFFASAPLPTLFGLMNAIIREKRNKSNTADLFTQWKTESRNNTVLPK